MVRDVGLVVGQPAHGVVAKVDVLERQAPQPFERSELEELLETSQLVVGEVDLSQGPAQGEAVSDFGQPVTTQPEVLEGPKRG